MTGTWNDLVREIFDAHDMTDTTCEYILWEHTAFPVGGLEYVTQQLRELKDS